MGMDVITVKKKMDTTKYKEGVVRVGFFESSKYDGGLSVAKVARWNEFGIGVPKRPFMRPAMFENRTKLKEFLRSAYMKAIKDNTDTMKVLERFGEQCKGMIQNQIISTYSPPNSPITIYGGWIRNKKTGKPVYVEGKGFNAPLRDTGIMLHSVQHQEEEIRK